LVNLGKNGSFLPKNNKKRAIFIKNDPFFEEFIRCQYLEIGF
jgi:hypothetical protein